MSQSVVIAEPSRIVAEGLAAIVRNADKQVRLSFAVSLDELERLQAKVRSRVIIINPTFVQYHTKWFERFRSEHREIRWVALVYACYSAELLGQFDGVISIADSEDSIASTLKRLPEVKEPEKAAGERLSDREIDVLKLLTTGMSNKEIADSLHISVNTVITHRKNISQKTGIKSVSGLTIYAVMQKLISIEN